MVKYELTAGVARITIDDGKVNVMSLPMLQALHAAFERAARDGAMVLLRSGRPGIFSAGFDLKVFAANDARRSVAMVRAGAELALKLLSFPAPVLAICEGHAFPMGAFLLLASDLRIGVDGPFKIGLNEVAIGIAVPSFALELARQRLAPAYLSRSATTGEMYSLAEGVTAGFLDRVVPAAELETAVESATQALHKVHRLPHANTKARLRAGAIQAVREAIDAELAPGASFGASEAIL
ncbi:MAG TPA: crotonase/enoyl-CoA hydratase family protein [Myxococcota bacterium]|nr:crotonase/enoyl-CoA hydratase family protein [Myxococcota bacterium]